MFDQALKREPRAKARSRAGFQPFLPLILLLGALGLLEGLRTFRPDAVPALLRNSRFLLTVTYLVLAGMLASVLIRPAGGED